MLRVVRRWDPRVGVGAGALLAMSVERGEGGLLGVWSARVGVSLCDVVFCSGIGSSCGPRPNELGAGSGTHP